MHLQSQLQFFITFPDYNKSYFFLQIEQEVFPTRNESKKLFNSNFHEPKVPQSISNWIFYTKRPTRLSQIECFWQIMIFLYDTKLSTQIVIKKTFLLGLNVEIYFEFVSPFDSIVMWEALLMGIYEKAVNPCGLLFQW